MNMASTSAEVNSRGLADELQKNFLAITELLDSCPASMINRRVNKDEWTPARIVQHVIKSSAGIPDEPSQPADRAFNGMEDILRKIFLDRTTKLQSPEFVFPEDRDYEKEELLQGLKKNRDSLLLIIRNKSLTDLCTGFAFPAVGYLTRYEWLQFINFHTQRHTWQLKNTLERLKEIDENN
jgi:hypothetical protein